MADAAVGSLVRKLGDLLVQEAINLHGVSDQVEWLKRELETMQCFLKDAEAKKNNGDDERVKNWVTKMRDIAFEAEDIIDTFMYYTLRRQQGQPGCIGFIKRLRELSRVEKYMAFLILVQLINTKSGEIPILPQLRDDIDMVGFDDEKKKIVLELVNEEKTNRSVISIVGMGGLGKTTLAKNIYNDHEEKRSFDIFAWVIISQEYTIHEVLKRISSKISATPSADTIQDLSDIETCCPTSLLDYAHQLVQRCGGLPLALVVLGGLVSTKPQTQDAWHKIVDSMKGQFVEGGKRCLKILALSYNDLPYYLKSCFLYFGCFKEDEKIPAKTLVRLWLAEGFLPKKNGTTTEEEIGFDCLEELAQRCLIQVTKRKYDDSAKRCQIHDLLRDMCISEAKESRFLKLYKNDAEDCMTTANAARRLIIFNEIETLNYSNSKLRGLFYDKSDNLPPFRALKGQLGKFKLLKVLFLLAISDISEFPSEIKSLIHLRYLEFHSVNLKEVPSWIGHLRNLQTFILSYGGRLEKISDSLWTIGNLRHVCLPTSTGPPPNMRNNVPKNLQILEWVNAGSWIGNALPKLTNLRKLKICNVSNDHANALSSSLQKLGRLASLSIEIGDEIPLDNIITAFSNQHCPKKLFLKGSLNHKQLPLNDVFPQQLVKLFLMFSKLEQDPMATLGKLPCLKYLKLYDAYEGKQMICSAAGFPQLLSLTILVFDQLEEWHIEDKTMPRLKSLWIINCKRLKMIPEGLKNVSLHRLVVSLMPEEFKTRMKENTGEDWYKIQHVPNISFP
ncbi:disease resistance protein RPH8A-like [Dioscorea cayenensis subsp. rotundata]|uniref:Disease resistance protein RPH8A-like n=1 Tax=Dioscorea cayennensis subsp. rotundata TaxID=55577 RepID=A0AB40AUW8_DIOCR|nr:disease resistance protein RPH8A-like [Dioscorea cayenensis subsp. rotundata]